MPGAEAGAGRRACCRSRAASTCPSSPSPRAGTRATTTAGASCSRSRTAAFKYIRAPRPELYDLQVDPRELQDQSKDDAARLATLDRALTEHLGAAAPARRAAKGPQPSTPRPRKKLAALGYVGGSVSARHLEDRPARRSQGQDRALQPAEAGGRRVGRGPPRRGDREGRGGARGGPGDRRGLHAARQLPEEGQARPTRPSPPTGRPWSATPSTRARSSAWPSPTRTWADSRRRASASSGRAQLDPRNGKVLWQLADLFMRKGDPDKAEAVIQDALARKVDEHRFLLKLGESQIEAKQWDEAERSSLPGPREEARASTPRTSTSASSTRRRARSTRPSPPTRPSWRSNAKAYRAAFNLAKLLQKAGRRAEAVTYFRKAVELQPDFGTGQLYLAKALLDSGDLAGAEEWARKGLDPQAGPAHRAARPLRSRRRLQPPGARRRRPARGGGRRAAPARGLAIDDRDRHEARDTERRTPAGGLRPSSPGLSCSARPAARGSPPDARHLVIVTIDTLRADQVGVYGDKDAATPHLDRSPAEGAMASRPRPTSPSPGRRTSRSSRGSCPPRPASATTSRRRSCPRCPCSPRS